MIKQIKKALGWITEPAITKSKEIAKVTKFENAIVQDTINDFDGTYEQAKKYVNDRFNYWSDEVEMRMKQHYKTSLT